MHNTLPDQSTAETKRLRAQVCVDKVLESGEVANWWCRHISECMPTAIIQSPRGPSPLPDALLDGLFDVHAETDFGQLSLREFLAHPESGARGFLAIRGGKVLAESYPGVRRDEAHFLASCAKPMAALLIEMLIDEGLIDDRGLVGDYLPSFRASDWDKVSLRDVLDMGHGLDCAESAQAFADRSSIAYRLLFAEFNEPSGERIETLQEVLHASRSVRLPGEAFDYGSAGTQVLTLLTEAVSGLPWPEFFRDRVWAHLGADASLQVHLSPDGVALAHGIVSARLRDLARFGMLYTPSWPQVSNARLVSDAAMARIRSRTRDRAFFFNSPDGSNYIDRLGEDTMLGNGRHWDCVWPDGDMFKSGFMGQGLYVSPGKDTVIAYFSSRGGAGAIRFLRPIISSGLIG